MSRMPSKNNRVLAIIALMAVTSFGVGGLVTMITVNETNELTAETAELSALRFLTHELASAIHNEEASVNDYVLSKSSMAVTRYDDSVDVELAIMARLRQAAVAYPRVHEAVETMHSASTQWRTEVADQVISSIQRGETSAALRFAAEATGDHKAVRAAVDAVGAELLVAEDRLIGRQDTVGITTVVGIAIAFGFLVAAFGVAMLAVHRFGRHLERDARHASVLNRFTEVTSFATEDHEVATANLVALGRLTGPDASVTHVLNRSLDRAVAEASTGNAIAEILPLHSLGRCAGVLRGTMYVTDDLADDLSVRCPVYPMQTGTLACVPLISGEPVGAVHLYWARPNALPLAARPGIARITEHAALAIGNRRLLAALHGQANTDPRTGLANSRSFDLAVEAALSARGQQETLSILMIDVDHFKQFNDRHGHPAGDEALRAFGAVLRSCMRDGDLAARYGGEEFAVLLRGQDPSVTAGIAERIRARTEATIISLAPGITDRITVSIGIASAPDQGFDRVSLLRVADEALYRAKDGGRNRVVGMQDVPVPTPTPIALEASTAAGGA
jgi:diguanylate cyclase (GGDEF)-like protein